VFENYITGETYYTERSGLLYILNVRQQTGQTTMAEEEVPASAMASEEDNAPAAEVVEQEADKESDSHDADVAAAKEEAQPPRADEHASNATTPESSTEPVKTAPEPVSEGPEPVKPASEPAAASPEPVKAGKVTVQVANDEQQQHKPATEVHRGSCSFTCFATHALNAFAFRSEGAPQSQPPPRKACSSQRQAPHHQPSLWHCSNPTLAKVQVMFTWPQALLPVPHVRSPPDD
jgi:hypothetical protein